MAKKTKSKKADLKSAQDAICKGDTDRLRLLIEKQPQLVEQRLEEEDRRPMLVHVCVGQSVGETPPDAVASIKTLVAGGAEVDALDDHPKGTTALQLAAGYNKLNIVEALVELGADVDLFEDHPYGMSAVTLALFEGYTDVARLLVAKGATVDLEVAAGTGDIDSLESFFDVNYSLDCPEGKIEFGTREMTTALVSPYLYACKNGQLESVFFLIRKGADVNLFPPGSDWGGIGASGLHWAAGHGHYELVKFLINYGAKLKVKDDVFERTPQQWAEYGGFKRIADYIEALTQKR